MNCRWPNCDKPLNEHDLWTHDTRGVTTGPVTIIDRKTPRMTEPQPYDPIEVCRESRTGYRFSRDLVVSVLDALPATTDDLAAELGRTKATIQVIMSNARNQNLVKGTPIRDGTKGRPRIEWHRT